MRPSRTASSQVSWSLLTEGVTQARLEAHRIRLMVTRVLAMVDTSPEKEHLWQVAGDLIQGIPERLTDLERVLDRTSYALVVMGEDFLRGRIPMDDRYVVDEATKSHPYAGPRRKDTAAARVVQRYLMAQAAVDSANTAENYFFDNPQKREIREFAETDAISNLPETAAESIREMDHTTISVPKARSEAMKAPPTPDDNLKEPGGRDFATLNRMIIDTTQPGVRGVPNGREEIPKARKPNGYL